MVKLIEEEVPGTGLTGKERGHPARDIMNATMILGVEQARNASLPGYYSIE